jgi:thiol-disulfide isomerase/thioredoxin
MKLYQKIIIIIVVSLITIFGGIVNWINQFVIVGVVFFVSTFFLIDNKSKKWLTLLCLLSPFLLMVGGSVLFFVLIGDPNPCVYPIVFISVISAFVGLTFKLWYLKFSKKRVIIFASLYLVLFIVSGYIFMYNWLNYNIAKDSIMQAEKISDIKIWDFSDNEIKLDGIDNKVIVLDFWSIHCGSCFRKFPDFEKIKNYYNNKDVVFYAVLIPWKRCDNENDELENRLKWMEKQNYTFNIVKTDTLTANLLGITGVPQLLVIDKNKKIISCNAYYNQDKKIVINNIYSVIDKLLEE